ncbi:AAA family ATPase [Nonomuraea lactucae]|uniref:AAA family ATPase n=1 Tax=Nonomuraea lactucae TaxID=2249762 RepID=UPI000DE3F468|nr:LuxR family transcriptional regulator [Nonomuraea lactucae]
MAKGADHSIIGREAECRRLAEMFRSCRESGGGALLVAGDPGMGKSELLRHSSRLAPDFLTVNADGVQAEEGLAYGVVHRVVRLLAPALRHLAQSSREVLERVLLRRVPRPRERALVAVATLGLLARASDRRPVLLRVDDLQWVDADSRYALGFVARRIGAERLALLAATDGETSTLMPGVPVLHLTGMSDHDCLRLLAENQPSPVAPAVREVLVHAAGGNPLILLELLRTLTPAALSSPAHLPDPLPLGTRLTRLRLGPFHRLPDGCRRLLLLLAAEPGLDPLSLFHLARRAGIDPVALRPAEESGLVVSSAGGVSFRHADLGRAIYHRADLADRHWAHELLARAFADAADGRRWWHEAALVPESNTELADELERQAVHARRHGDQGRAAALMERSAELTREDARRARRLVTAGDCSRRSGRPRHATRLLERAAPLVGADQPSLRGRADYLRGVLSLHHAMATDAHETLMTAADVLAADDRLLALKALLTAAEAGLYAGDVAVPAQAGLRAMTLLESSRGTDRSEVRFAAGLLLGFADFVRGRLPAAVAGLREITATAVQVGDPLLLTWAAHGALFAADAARARGLASRAVSLARAAGDTPAAVHAMQYLAYSECWLSGTGTATLTATEALRLAGESGQLTAARNLMGILTLAAGISGDAEGCHQYAGRVAGEAAAHRLGLSSALGLWGLAQLDLARRNWAGAAAALHRIARTGLGHPAIAMEAVPAYVEAAVRTGERARAERAAASFIRWAEAVGRGWPVALAARCRALLGAADAERHFREALRLHPSADREFERARTALLYGEFLNRERRRGDARVPLREAAEIFRRHRASLWLDRTRAELRASGDDGSATDPAAPAPGEAATALTSRQSQIAELVAAGATNKQVATSLSLSPRTVDYHLRRIFQRLGITSRADLIRRLTAERAHREHTGLEHTGLERAGLERAGLERAGPGTAPRSSG